MAGIDKDTPVPTEIKLHKVSNKLELAYASGERYELSAEFLRVFTPSAEARGHGPGQETLQTGKRNVEISRIEPVGTYAVCFIFSDGHNSGLYSWDLLHNFCLHQDELWAEYLKQLDANGASRDIDTSSKASSGGSCGQRH